MTNNANDFLDVAITGVDLQDNEDFSLKRMNDIFDMSCYSLDVEKMSQDLYNVFLHSNYHEGYHDKLIKKQELIDLVKYSGTWVLLLENLRKYAKGEITLSQVQLDM